MDENAILVYFLNRNGVIVLTLNCVNRNLSHTVMSISTIFYGIKDIYIYIYLNMLKVVNLK